MKAIHTKSQPNISTKDERISTRENPVSNSISSNSSSIHDSSSFAPRRANKLKEFFGLFSIHNKLPQTRGGGTSQYTELSLKESSAKNLSKNFEMKVNSISKFDNEDSGTDFKKKVNSVSKIDQGNSVPEFSNHRGNNKSTLKNYIRFNRNIRLAGSFAVIMLMFIATGIVVPYYIETTKTEAAEDHFGDSLLTFTSESLSASVTLSNLAANGSFATSTAAQQAKFSISTTNYTGYTLAIQAGESNVLTGANGGTLNSIPAGTTVTTSEYQNNSKSGVNLNNTWGFLPNFYQSGNSVIANTDTYLPAPAANSSTTLDVTSAANTEPKQYTIGLGARADYTNTVDTFSNTFILQYIANPVNYAITYSANAGSDTVTNMPYADAATPYVQTGYVEATSITLSNLVPVRANYTFLGWCSEATGTPVNNSDTCAGTIYNDQAEGATPNLTFSLSQTSANTATLYAMWHQEFSIDSISTMQDWAYLTPSQYSAALSTMVEGQSYEMVDNRDNTTYNVAKLADGKVWLQDNLQLGGTSTIALTPSDTNIASNFTLPASSTDKFADNSTGYTTAGINTSEKTTVGSGSWKYGVYYNYCAASAGNYCYASGSGVDVADTITDSPYDICPAGWRMPTGGPSGEYRTLATALTGTSTGNMTGDNYTTVVNALHLPLSSDFRNGYPNNRGRDGLFWSSTRRDGSSMYVLSLSTSTVLPENNYSRYIGGSVRCVVKGNDVAINFNGNGATSGSNRTLGYKAGSATLPSVLSLGFEKDGNVGLSWNTAADGSGVSYAPGASITADMANLTLYAQWTTGSWMQDIAYADCTTTPQTVYDIRDGKAYTVQRLKLTTTNDNGLCWMLDNLQLDIAANKANITSTNTNANDTALGYLKNGGGSSPYTTAAAVNTNASTWSGDKRYTQAMYNIDNANYDASYGNGTHKSGYYYNYCAASAGSYCYNSSSGTGNASQDICPAGWQMPAGDSSSTYSYQKLYEAYGSNAANFKNALHVGLSGYFSGGISNQGSDGNFWASTYINTSNMRRLYVNASSVNPQNNFNRGNGYSVRCVLKATS